MMPKIYCVLIVFLLLAQTSFGSKELDEYTAYQRIIPELIRKRQYTLAEKYLALYKPVPNTKRSINDLVNFYHWRFRLDSLKNNYALALKDYHLYTLAKDSALNETKNMQIRLLNSEYKTEGKDQSLKTKQEYIGLLLRQEKLLKYNLQQTILSRNLIVAGLMMLLLLLGLSYNRFRLKQRANKILEKQQVEISIQNGTLQSLSLQKDLLLEQKETLMKEIHHRVKNNLQVVISLLNTQSAYLNDELVYAPIRESQHRMQSISLIHQKLYQSESRALIDIQGYILELVDYLSQSYALKGKVSFEKNIVPIEIDVARAVPIGLILNEAIINSIKYAFPDHSEGIIQVSLKALIAPRYKLEVRDSGIGLLSPFHEASCDTLGINLIKNLTRQIKGSLSINHDEGLSVAIEFDNDHAFSYSP